MYALYLSFTRALFKLHRSTAACDDFQQRSSFVPPPTTTPPDPQDLFWSLRTDLEDTFEYISFQGVYYKNEYPS